MSDPECLFCRIGRQEIPATVVRETERTVAFRDIAPAAPVHVLVIPKEHHREVAQLGAADPELLSLMLEEAAAVARDEGLADAGWRLVFNVGADGGQTVDHVHAHVLGGRQLRWPPG